jgi:hypothetical protein
MSGFCYTAQINFQFKRTPVLNKQKKTQPNIINLKFLQIVISNFMGNGARYISIPMQVSPVARGK